MATELLFSRVDIFSVAERSKEELKQAFKKVSTSEIEADPIALTSKLIEYFSLDVPSLQEDKKYATTKQVQVDVSHDPRRFIMDRSQPFFMAGTEVRIIVPFRGDPGMFGVQPSSFTLNPPRGEIKGHELHLTYQLVESGFDVEGAASRTITQVNQYLQNLRSSAEQLKIELQQVINAQIQQRKREHTTQAEIVAKLSIPIKKDPHSEMEENVIQRTIARQPSGSAKQGAWDIFLSHASEDKDAIAKPLAEALERHGLRVWYDDTALRLGDSLRESIDRGLGKSRFGVVILSAHFFGKHWPQTELNGLATREANGSKVILPVWHGVGFNEVSSYSVTLADRKAAKTADGLTKVVEQIIDVVGPEQT
jgi:hypothetical protein